ncbi:porin [Caballeronia sp. LZ065]|uniref:porin n=1 Tax=Caballeronia sp. LZ065 TaxID=3038571 RepID=UPI002863249A|nr:porin [Caballeronia sp. LZ065]MDR5781153.1 porin [Caballeronia sp. LZ065]
MLFAGPREQHIDIGAKNQFEKFRLGAAYSHVDVTNPTYQPYLAPDVTPPATSAWSSWKSDNFEVNAAHNFAPDRWIGAGYTFTYGRLKNEADLYHPQWHQLTVMVNFDLGKRTSTRKSAYQLVARAETGAGFDSGQILYAAGGASPSAHQLVLRVAMRHRF